MASGDSSAETENDNLENFPDEEADITDGSDQEISMPERKRDSFFNLYIETVKSSKDLKEVFEKVLYLDSYMKKREIIHVTESVTNAIQTVIHDITPSIVRNIIRNELKR